MSFCLQMSSCLQDLFHFCWRKKFLVIQKALIEDSDQTRHRYFHCVHMSESTFVHVVVHIYHIFRLFYSKQVLCIYFYARIISSTSFVSSFKNEFSEKKKNLNNRNIPRYGQVRKTTSWYYFFIFTQAGFDISCKLSPIETVCMKSQILFSVF